MEQTTLASITQHVPSEIMAPSIYDLMYLFTTPIFAALFSAIVALLLLQYRMQVKKYDEGLKEIKKIGELVIRDNQRLDDHINDKSAHNYRRRGSEDDL